MKLKKYKNKPQLFSQSEIRRLKSCRNATDQIRVLSEIHKELIESEEYKKLKPLTPEEENSLRQFAEILLDRAFEEETKSRRCKNIQVTPEGQKTLPRNMADSKFETEEKP